MVRDEKQTRIELINPALHESGWTDALIREERTPGGTDIIDGKLRKRKGRTDYLLCIPVIEGKPPLPIAVLEAKAEDKIPSLGIQQAKNYIKNQSKAIEALPGALLREVFDFEVVQED